MADDRPAFLCEAGHVQRGDMAAIEMRGHSEYLGGSDDPRAPDAGDENVGCILVDGG